MASANFTAAAASGILSARPWPCKLANPPFPLSQAMAGDDSVAGHHAARLPVSHSSRAGIPGRDRDFHEREPRLRVEDARRERGCQPWRWYKQPSRFPYRPQARIPRRHRQTNDPAANPAAASRESHGTNPPASSRIAPSVRRIPGTSSRKRFCYSIGRAHGLSPIFPLRLLTRHVSSRIVRTGYSCFPPIPR